MLAGTDDLDRLLRFATVALATGVGFFLATNAAIQAQTSDLKEFFPQIAENTWHEMAESGAVNTNGFVHDVLSGLDNIPLPVWERIPTLPESDLPQAAEFPTEFAGKPFRYSGSVVRYESANSDRRFHQTVVRTVTGDEILVQSGTVPRIWSRTSVAGEPVSGFGVFVFAHESRPVLVSGRLSWFPVNSDREKHVGPGIATLSSAGFDAGLMDEVQHHSDTAVTSGEYNVFASFLESVSRIDGRSPSADSFAGAAALNLADLARSPRQLAGEVFEIAGQLRRITPVQIQQPSLQSALGQDRYWQLDVFVPLGNQQVLLGKPGDSEPVRITGSYGVTVLLLTMPSALESAELPISIRVPGFFLKTWEHQSIATRNVSSDLRRPNPVFAGLASRFEQVDPVLSAGLFKQLMPLFWGGLLAFVIGLLFWSRRRQASWHARQRESRSPDFPAVASDQTSESGLHP